MLNGSVKVWIFRHVVAQEHRNITEHSGTTKNPGTTPQNPEHPKKDIFSFYFEVLKMRSPKTIFA